MKRCPTCQRTFTEEHLTFCVEDGTPLVASPVEDYPDEVTRVGSSARQNESNETGSSAGGPTPPYQPPGSYQPPSYGDANKRKAWPWVLGIVAFAFMVILGVGIAAAVLIPRAFRASNRNLSVNTNANRSDLNRNANLNSNANVAEANANESYADDSTLPPTDQAVVLADLKNLEDEWTIANINADKKKLSRILADDYVGITDGRAQGKAEYLRTIERDTAIQHWEFDNLKVTLNGDRASLSGILRLDIKDQNGEAQQVTYRFVDKFVWRDGRWQATASEVEPVKPGTAV